LIQMLALDVDGTLAARGDEVSSATRQALHEASRAGVQIVIATGRRFRTAQRAVLSLGLPVPVICLGGALIKDHDKRTLRAHVFARPDFLIVAQHLHDHGLALVAQRDSHELGGADFIVDASTPWTDAVENYVAGNEAFCDFCPAPTDQPRDDVLVMGTFGEQPALRALQSALDAAHPDRFLTVLVPTPWEGSFYLEVIPAHVSKWAGLEDLARQREIAPERICAVGDQLNDLSMVEQSGLGIAMDNGHEELKKVADWVCGRHDEDGLVEVVAHILEVRRG
jgi:Cof subfamily protein (haloacid dehalogenase superfamily)